MKNNLAKMLSALMIATFLLGFAAVLPTFAAGNPEPNAYIIVDPALSQFGPPHGPAVVVGSQFNISVSLINITGVGGIEWHLKWDPTLLNCTAITEILFHTWTPSADWGNINSLQLKYNNTAGTADYAQAWTSLPIAEGDGSAPGNVTVANFPPNGEAPTANMTMKILKLPTMAEVNLTCDFAFTSVKIGDTVGGKIIDTPSSTGNAPIKGTYVVWWSAPAILPFYTVSSFTATSVNQIFTISVYVNNLDPSWEAVGFEFTLNWNNSLIHFVSWTNGSWLPPYAVAPDQGILSLLNNGTGFAQIGQVILPDVNGTWHAPFPSAPNPNASPLAVITFKAILQGVFPTVLSCALALSNLKIANWLAQPISQGPSVDGLYVMEPSITGREIDVYTGWPYPYGGQGLGQPSDMYWPQKAVSLFANVTYNGWPEQQKDVAFQIMDPTGTTWAIVYARTDVNGIAEVDFRLPWPCDDPEQYFGVWTIVGSVDIACTIVNDTVQFHYDYLARIFKQTTDYGSYNHTDYVNVTVNYGTYLQNTNATYLDELTNSTMALQNVTIVVTALDEVGVPFAFEYIQVPFGGAPRSLIGTNLTVFTNYINFTVTLTLYIPKYAVAGKAEIDCAVLNNWPFFGGTVQSGYYDPITMTWMPYDPTYINILAQ